MWSTIVAVGSIPVRCECNVPSVIATVRTSFPEVERPVVATVRIVVGESPPDHMDFYPSTGALTAHFHEVGPLDGYGFHNVCKWLLRLSAFILEQQSVVCLHASAVK